MLVEIWYLRHIGEGVLARLLGYVAYTYWLDNVDPIRPIAVPDQDLPATVNTSKLSEDQCRRMPRGKISQLLTRL